MLTYPVYFQGSDHGVGTAVVGKTQHGVGRTGVCHVHHYMLLPTNGREKKIDLNFDIKPLVDMCKGNLSCWNREAIFCTNFAGGVYPFDNLLNFGVEHTCIAA